MILLTKLGTYKEDVKNRWDEIKTDSAEKWENTRAILTDKWDHIQTDTAETVSAMKKGIGITWDAVRTKTFETWENLKKETTNAWQKMKDKVDEHGGGIKGLIWTFTAEYEAKWDDTLAAMEKVTGIKFTEIADKVGDALERIRRGISNVIDKIKEWNATSVKEKVFNIKESITQAISTVAGGDAASNFSGTSFFPGGLTMVGELGPELVVLPRGSRIYNDRETKEILSRGSGVTQNITIVSPKPLSERELAREFLNTSRKLALGVI